MWSFTMKKYFVSPVIVAIYLNNAQIYMYMLCGLINSTKDANQYQWNNKSFSNNCAQFDDYSLHEHDDSNVVNIT